MTASEGGAAFQYFFREDFKENSYCDGLCEVIIRW